MLLILCERNARRLLVNDYSGRRRQRRQNQSSAIETLAKTTTKVAFLLLFVVVELFGEVETLDVSWW